MPEHRPLPKKNPIHGAKVATDFRRRKEFGITKSDWKIDMAKVRARKRKMIDGLMDVHRAKYESSGAELHGPRPLWRSEDHRSHAERRRHADLAGQDGHP